MRWEDRFPGKAFRGEDVKEVARLAERAQEGPSLGKVIGYRLAGTAGFFIVGGAAAALFTEIEMPGGALGLSSILAGLFPYAVAEQRILGMRHEARMARLWLEQYHSYQDTAATYARHNPQEASGLERTLLYDTLNRS